MTDVEIKSVGIPIPSRQEWLRARHSLVGASEVAALFDLSPYGETIQTIYDRKIRPLTDEVVDDAAGSPDQERGRYLEPIILMLFAKQSGHPVIASRLYLHPEEDRFGATPDAEQVVDQELPTVEVKSLRGPKFNYLKYNGLPDGYIMQKQAQLEVTGRPWGNFVFHTADAWEMIAFPIERDREFGAALRAKVREFWTYVDRRQRPDAPLSIDDLPGVVAPRGTLTIRTDQEWADATKAYAERKAMLDEAETLVDSSKAHIKVLMGGYGSCQGAGVRVHFKQREGKLTFDHKELANAYPLDPITAGAKIMGVLDRVFGSSDNPELRAELMGALSQSTLDLSKFFKRGAGYDDMRLYVLKEDAEETAMLAKPKLRLNP